MTATFDWKKYEGQSPQEVKSTPVQPQNTQFDWSKFEQASDYDTIQPPQSFGDMLKEVSIEAPKGLARIGLRGGASLLAASTKGIGGLLNLLSKMGQEGKPGEIKGMGTRAIRSLGNWFQEQGEGGQQYLKDQIEKVLGKSYGSGEEALTGFIERAADIYGRGPFKGMAVPSITGGAAGEAAKQLGAGEEGQQIAEIGGVFGPDVIKGLTTIAKQLKASESGLILPKIVEQTGEKLRGLKAKVFGGEKERIYKNVSEQAENLINKIKNERLPLSKEIEEGIDVGARIQKNLEEVQSLANKMTNKIESKLISDYLNEIENKIKFGGVPTNEQEEILKLTNKYRNKFGELEGGTRFFTPAQYTKQFRNINKDLTNLYQTKFVHGERLDTMRFYEGLKDKITKTLEEGTPKPFSNLFKETNKDFSQSSRIDRFNQIMEKITDNGIINSKKLNNYMTTPRKANVLRKQIGQEGFDKLKLISKDLNKVQNKLNLIEELNLGSAIKSGMTMKILSMLKIPIGVPVHLTTKGAQLVRGYMLTSPQGARDITNLLKAMQSGSEKSIRTYLLKLDENAKKYEKSTYPK